MKVAIASDDGIVISSHFGQTKGFAIYDVDQDGKISKSYIKNTFTGHARGLHDSHEHHHSSNEHTNKHKAILDALAGCDIVISNGMGRMIYNDLNNAGIKAVITEETSVENAVKLLLNNQLKDNPNKGCVH